MISSWSGWFLAVKLKDNDITAITWSSSSSQRDEDSIKPTLSTSEANIRNLENVFSNIRAFAAITGGAMKLGPVKLHKKGRGTKKECGGKHGIIRIWNYQDT